MEDINNFSIKIRYVKDYIVADCSDGVSVIQKAPEPFEFQSELIE